MISCHNIQNRITKYEGKNIENLKDKSVNVLVNLVYLVGWLHDNDLKCKKNELFKQIYKIMQLLRKIYNCIAPVKDL